MKGKGEWLKLALLGIVFLICFYLPVERLQGWAGLRDVVWESFYLLRWYAREHVILCLLPAFFIAGAIAVFVSQAAVMRCLGARANKFVAYGVAAVSGSILTVCSCTVLPLFAGIWRWWCLWRRSAGLFVARSRDEFAREVFLFVGVG